MPVFSSEVVGTEDLVGYDHRGGHEPDDPSEMAVPPLADGALSFVFSRFIHRGIESPAAMSLLSFSKAHVSPLKFNEEAHCRLVSDPTRGGDDLRVPSITGSGLSSAEEAK